MFDAKIHRGLYLLGLCVIALFMPLSEYIVNVAQFFLATNWILELNFKNKINKLKEHKSILIFMLLFIVPLIWMINSENINFGLIDLKIRLPLLALPFIIGTSEALTKNRLNFILLCFITGVSLSTFLGILGYHDMFFDIDTSNVRNISIFVSHIRLSLMISLSIFVILYWIYSKSIKTRLLTLLACVLIAWFAYFLLLTQVLTGIIAIITVIFVILIALLFSKVSRKEKITYFSIIVFFIVLITTYIGVQVKDFFTPTQSKELTERTHTKKGNPYFNDYNSKGLENGNYVYRNISKVELYEEWAKRSDFDIKGKNRKNEGLYSTLIRYLTSKGLPKDAEGIAQLSDQDIRNIEDGISNYKLAENGKGLQKRIYVSIWELHNYVRGGNPSGHSLTQRIEYLKVGVELFKRNLLFGTGTGDLNDDYMALYDELNSKLLPDFRHRAHNQVLTFFISFGIIGGIICMLAWIYPFVIEWDRQNFYFFVFFIIATVSMFSDDTLETTTGVVFCSYFYSLFLWGRK